MELWLSSGAVLEIRTIGTLEEMELWLFSGAVSETRTEGPLDTAGQVEQIWTKAK